MKTGQMAVIAVSVAIAALMGYMLLNGEDESPKGAKVEMQEQKIVAQKQTKESQIDSLISSDEVKKIEELKGAVESKSEGLSAAYITRCAPCHGNDGKGILAPSIAGKSKAGILASLKDYKEGKMQNSLMKGLLTNTPDAELETLAEEISKFKE